MLCRNMARKSRIINDSTPRPRTMFLSILGSRKAVNALQKLISQVPVLERVAY